MENIRSIQNILKPLHLTDEAANSIKFLSKTLVQVQIY